MSYAMPETRSHRRLAATVALLVALALGGLPAPAQAAVRTPVSIEGVGHPVEVCDGESSDVTLEFDGDLQGCLWATVTDTTWLPAAGVYFESGTERFEGCVDTEGTERRCGAFATTYVFKAKLPPGPEPDLSEEIRGGCLHPIVDGSGEGGFTGVSGRFMIIDDAETGTFPYRGHLRFR